MTNLFNLDPIKKFIRAIGKDVQKYFGRDPSAIVHLQPDGMFYGVALFDWLKQKKKNIILTTMQDDGKELEEKKVKGRKVLLVDNDIITGKGYKRSMEALRERKARLQIKDIKFATYTDRIGLADFSVWRYSPDTLWRLQELDVIDLNIISLLAGNGRMSFAQIATKVKLSQVAAKNRVDNLLKKDLLAIRGALVVSKFYTLSAGLQIEVDGKALDRLIAKLAKKQEIYHLVKRSGRLNLTVSMLARTIEDVEDFVEREVRSFPGVHNAEVFVGEIPVVPQTIAPKLNNT